MGRVRGRGRGRVIGIGIGIGIDNRIWDQQYERGMKMGMIGV